jgi:hypothetical protein
MADVTPITETHRYQGMVESEIARDSARAGNAMLPAIPL